MDSLHTIGFYVSAGLSVAGGLSVAFLPDRTRRGLGLAVVGIGLAGIYASLSAAFAGAVALVCYGGCAALVAAPGYRVIEQTVSGRWRQLASVAAAALLVLMAYSAFRGHFAHAIFYGGEIGSASVGRLLFAHDALATDAVGAIALAALVGATAAWRSRDPRP